MKFDIAIVGAGPAGSSAAIKLAKSGLKIAVIDQASFPRDKICGDALSVDVVNQLGMLSPELASEFERLSEKIPSQGVSIFAPNGKQVNIPFVNKGVNKCGYVIPRIKFDNLLFRQLNKFPNVENFENQKISEIKKTQNGVKVLGENFSISCPLIIGADGAHSVVNKHLGNIRVDKDHYSAGLRVYYKNVHGFNDGNYIELYFFKDILPGYLWIFPLPNNKANVGIGMLSSTVSKKRVNLKVVLNKLLRSHPLLKDRFKKSIPLETVKGFGLPLGSKKRSISGERFLLTGDAAGLIDPFSGEGIANAIRSGRVAAEHAISCFATNNFSEGFNKAYDKEIYSRMWREFKISRGLQNLCKYPGLFNFIVNKANQSKYLTELLTQALAEIDVKQVLTKPGFYLRLLFK
ncbi:MAG: geranylgeranyl reductase family protein [Bacteroidota bacterium]